jgi:hypothetical protein
MYRQVPQSLLQPSLFGQSATWALQSGWNRGTWRPHFLTCASGPLAGSAECVLPIVMRCRYLCFFGICCLVVMDSGRVLGVAIRMFEGLKDRVREKTIFLRGGVGFWKRL